MVVCKFYQQGRCKFGANCKNEHPGFQQQNRFNSFNDNFSSNSIASSRRDSKHTDNTSYGIKEDTIVLDLGNERPQWILSSYGPGIKAPIQLMGGPQREMSFEEMRLMIYEAAAVGKLDEANMQAQAAWSQAEQQIQMILQKPGEAVQYVLNGEKEHPNRLDIINQSMGQQPATNQQQNGFGQQSSPFAAAQGNSLASRITGGPAFQSSSGGGFNSTQSSTQGGFGAFNQPANPQGGGFGTGFNQPSNNGFGANNTPQPAASPFAQAQPAQQTPAFGQTGFGQPAQQTTAFGQTGFGQPAQQAPAFGQTGFNQPAAGGFGGQPQMGNFQTDETGNPVPFPIQQNNPVDPALGVSVRDIRLYSTRTPDNKLLTWHGQPVQYVEGVPCYQRQDNGQIVKIHFPDGPPKYNPDTELPLDRYDEQTKLAYLFLKENGYFKDGWMPSLPPRREWTNWEI